MKGKVFSVHLIWCLQKVHCLAHDVLFFTFKYFNFNFNVLVLVLGKICLVKFKVFEGFWWKEHEKYLLSLGICL